MRADVERWDRKYAELSVVATPAPEPLLRRFRQLLDGHGRALDLACGLGGNTVLLASLGYAVVGIDASLVALRRCREALAAQGLTADLIAADLDRFPLPGQYFDLMVVVRYLNRALVPALRASLRPGGLLIYQTFNRNVLRRRPGFPAEFTLEFGELSRLFAGFDIIASNDASEMSDDQSWLVARRNR